MQKVKITKTYKFILATLAVAFVFSPKVVDAGSSSYDYGGGLNLYPSQQSASQPTYSYSQPSYSYTPSYGYNYAQPSSSYSSGPSSVPSYSYQYAQPTPAKTTSKSTSKADAKSYSYVYSSNKNTLTNTSSNTNNNTNVNNNNVSVIVYGGAGVSTSTYNTSGPTTNPTLDGNCQISPTQAIRGQNVSFSAYATGGTGSYTYQWSGSEGLSAYSQSFSGRFYSTGNKIVYVLISSGNQSITRTCNVDVRDDYNNNDNLNAYCTADIQNPTVGQNVTWRVYPSGGNNGASYTYNWTGTDGLYSSSNIVSRTYSTNGVKYAYVTVYSNGQTYNTQCSVNVLGGTVFGTTYTPPTYVPPQTTGTPVSGVFLSQLPATGIDDLMALKGILITLALVIWSIFMAYIVVQKKKRKSHAHIRDRAEAFKLANLAKRNG